MAGQIAAGSSSETTTASHVSGSQPNLSRRHTVTGQTSMGNLAGNTSTTSLPTNASIGFLMNDEALGNLEKFLNYYGEYGTVLRLFSYVLWSNYYLELTDLKLFPFLSSPKQNNPHILTILSGSTTSEMKRTMRCRQREKESLLEQIESLERQIDQLRCGYEYDSIKR